MSKIRKKTSADKPTTLPNAYEQERLLNIQANNRKLESLNVKRIVADMSSLVDSTMEKKRKSKQRKPIDEDEDEDYEPIYDDVLFDKDCENSRELATKTKKQRAGRMEERKKSQFIPPLSLANIFKMNNTRKRKTLGDDALRSISSAMEVMKEAICSQQQNDPNADIDTDDDFTNEDLDRAISEMRRENKQHVDNADDAEDENDPMDDENEDVPEENICDKEVGSELNGNSQIISVGNELITSGAVKKTRGFVYYRKLTALAPGEKIFIEFNADGIPIGQNASIFSFFLEEQVRNRAVCPVQVSGWEEFKPETLDHLWRCITEKCDFDNPQFRRDAVMKHARCLFRDSRYKLRRKYIIEPNLMTKEEQLKNKPKDMLKADWKYLVDLWRTPKFQEKSTKAKESRSFQKMPHYTGTKSHARVKEELNEKNGRDCSRVDLLLETRKRKTKNPVDSTNLACNMRAIDEVNKLKKERDEGLNQKTDDEILIEVLGKDTHGYLRCYGRGKNITTHFGVRPSRLNLANEVLEVKRTTKDVVEEAKIEVEKAKKEAEDAKKEAQEARKDAEAAKNEAEATRNEMEARFAANNKIWEDKLMGLLKKYIG